MMMYKTRSLSWDLFTGLLRAPENFKMNVIVFLMRCDINEWACGRACVCRACVCVCDRVRACVCARARVCASVCVRACVVFFMCAHASWPTSYHNMYIAYSIYLQRS